jgi:hypothetical protein
MSCGCGYLEYSIGIKKPKLCRGPSNDHSWAVGMIIGRSSTKFRFFYANGIFKIAATAGHILTLDPIGKCSNAFFSETTEMIKAKLYMNVHWMVLYKLYVFYSDMKLKMAATTGLSLT